jgi:GT2 family glycosyltransferase
MTADGRPPAPPPVGVAIATRNRRDSLLRTLAHLTSLPEQPPIVVVDNDARDGTAAAVAERFPAVAVLPLARNRGVAARNLAARELKTPFVAFSDDDSWWEPGALAAAAAILAAHPEVGLLAARILVGEDERRLDTVSADMAASPTPPGLPGPRIDGFIACGAVVRSEAFFAAGGFCERFLIGAEESLLTLDLRAAGWELCYAEEVVAVHSPHRSQRGGRTWLERRNELWTSWLRRPVRRALRETAELARAAPRDAIAARALAGALAGLPWALANRRPRRVAAADPGTCRENPRTTQRSEMFEPVNRSEEASR